MPGYGYEKPKSFKGYNKKAEIGTGPNGRLPGDRLARDYSKADIDRMAAAGDPAAMMEKRLQDAKMPKKDPGLLETTKGIVDTVLNGCRWLLWLPRDDQFVYEPTDYEKVKKRQKQQRVEWLTPTGGGRDRKLGHVVVGNKLEMQWRHDDGRLWTQ